MHTPCGAPSPWPVWSAFWVISYLALIFPILLVTTAQQSLAAPKKTTVTMGFNPAENSEMVENNGKKLATYFKAKTGVEIKTFIATDYTALVEALRNGQIDIAWLPAFSYVKAEEIAGAQVLLKVVRKGHATLWSAIVTRIDKPFKTVEDLKGKNIAWVDPSSATGHIMPKAELMRKKHIDPDKFFRRQVFAGSHEAVVLSVINGTVDAGATFANDEKGESGSWTRFLKGGDTKKVRVLYLSDAIPGDTVTASRAFARDHKDMMDLTVKTLVEMPNDPEGKEVLYKLYQVEGLVTAKPAEYQSLKDAAKLLKFN